MCRRKHFKKWKKDVQFCPHIDFVLWQKRKDAYVAFAKEFGTHYVKQAEFGASLTFSRVFNSRSESQTTESYRKDCFSRSTSACFGVGIPNKAELNTCVTNEHEKCMSDKKVQESGTTVSNDKTIIQVRDTTISIAIV